MANMSGPRDHSAGFRRLSEERQPSTVTELGHFLRTNKKWWITPIIAALLVVAVLVILGGTAAAPFIYTLF